MCKGLSGTCALPLNFPPRSGLTSCRQTSQTHLSVSLELPTMTCMACFSPLPALGDPPMSPLLDLLEADNLSDAIYLTACHRAYSAK